MQTPSPLPHLPTKPEGPAVPRYHKLSFPTYDGKEDLLGWLLKCEQFFRGQQTCHTDWVWLTSYHLTGTTQMWYTILERDAGRPEWEEFKRLCHQHFGPPLSTNHLADLARLPFTSSFDVYLDAFQARMAHAGRLSPYQQAQLFTGGLPDHISVDVELHDPRSPAGHAAGTRVRAAEYACTARPASAVGPPASPQCGDCTSTDRAGGLPGEFGISFNRASSHYKAIQAAVT